MIVIGYQGIGKTTACQKSSMFFDLQSSLFKVDGKRFDGWQTIYAKVAMSISKQGYCVFVSSHEVVRKALFQLNSSKQKICVCYPSLKLKDVWIKRLQQRYADDKSQKNFLALANAEAAFQLNIIGISSDADKFGFTKIQLEDLEYDLIDLVCEAGTDFI